MNMLPIDCWMRPKELLQKLAADNPDRVVCTEPALFVDGFDLTDIVQGFIGTCYFLSAIGCLGIRELANPRYPLLTNMFTMEREGAVYNSCGAFLVRFYRAGQECHVLIDDRLPTAGDNFAFSHSKLDHEMWVALLEKAYAKLNDCYEAIESGMISQALCDLSNGASDQVVLKDKQGEPSVNPDLLWSQLEDMVKSGYMLGAGSNTGVDSDFINGIAQGHAYMLLRAFSDSSGQTKLVELQNPHGRGEWDGDWSDSSELWTQWWRNTLWGSQQAPVDDGRFWMSFDDFIRNYNNLYICRLLPNRKDAKAAWKGHTAAGNAKPFHSPTFTVTSSKSCKVWVQLEQRDQRGKEHPLVEAGEPEGPIVPGAPMSEAKKRAISKDGYAFIIFYVLDNGGRRATAKLGKDTDGLRVCSSREWKPTNVRQVSAEVFLEAADTPYTIVCVVWHQGWEEEFTLSVFSADDCITLKQLPDELPTATP